MLDSYTNTMCIDSWGRLDYARALIDIKAHRPFRDNMAIVIPYVEGSGSYFAYQLKVGYKRTRQDAVVLRVWSDDVINDPKHWANKPIQAANKAVEKSDNDVEDIKGRDCYFLAMASGEQSTFCYAMEYLSISVPVDYRLFVESYTDKIRPGNGIGNVPIIRETFQRRIHGVSVPMVFPNGYESPIAVSVLQRSQMTTYFHVTAHVDSDNFYRSYDSFSYRPEVVENYSSKWVDKGTWILEAVIYRHMGVEVTVMVEEEICIHTEMVGMAMVGVGTCTRMEVVGMVMVEEETCKRMEVVGMVMAVEATCRHREVVGMVMVEGETCRYMEVVEMVMVEEVTYKCMEVAGMVMVVEDTCKRMEVVGMVMVVEETCKRMEVVGRVMVEEETCKRMEVVGMVMGVEATCRHREVAGMVMVEGETCRYMEVVEMVMAEEVNYKCMEVVGMVMVEEETYKRMEVVDMVMVGEVTYKRMGEVETVKVVVGTCRCREVAGDGR
ncbi:hypothetical protein Tco_0524881 [Tanacetum coccineum]